jgi:hypothetical protein
MKKARTAKQKALRRVLLPQIRFDFAAFFLLEFRFAYFQPPVPKPPRRSGKDTCLISARLFSGNFHGVRTQN